MLDNLTKDELEAYAKDRFGVDLDKRRSLQNLQAEVAMLEAQEEPQEEPDAEAKAPDAMNEFALRIWNGQSPDLPIRVRVDRVVDGLKRQGFTDMTNLSLPTAENYRRYL